MDTNFIHILSNFQGIQYDNNVVHRMLKQLPYLKFNIHTNKLCISFRAGIVKNRKASCLEITTREELMIIELNEDFFLFKFILLNV
jgi:hypothetical protein